MAVTSEADLLWTLEMTPKRQNLVPRCLDAVGKPLYNLLRQTISGWQELLLKFATSPHVSVI